MKLVFNVREEFLVLFNFALGLRCELELSDFADRLLAHVDLEDFEFGVEFSWAYKARVVEELLAEEAEIGQLEHRQVAAVVDVLLSKDELGQVGDHLAFPHLVVEAPEIVDESRPLELGVDALVVELVEEAFGGVGPVVLGDVVEVVDGVLAAEGVVGSVEELGEEGEDLVGEELALGDEAGAFVVGVAKGGRAVFEEGNGEAEVKV